MKSNSVNAVKRQAGAFPQTVLAKSVFSQNQVARLREADKPEILEFLNFRPVHTIIMTSLIEDNGIEGKDNRGVFYGYRSQTGTLEGVALIGHTTLVESRSDDSLTAFAMIARESKTLIHLIMSESKTVESFWRSYAGEFRKPRLVCTELLFELNFPFPVQEGRWKIRPAKVDEVEQIAEAHAEVAFMESGACPMEKDREGFFKRCLKRIEKERTFVVFENGKLIFKADIAAETSDVIYLEGIYVSPEYRGQNIGTNCLSGLSLQLLNRAQNICLLSNAEFKAAHRSFSKAGYKNTDSFRTIFV